MTWNEPSSVEVLRATSSTTALANTSTGWMRMAQPVHTDEYLTAMIATAPAMAPHASENHKNSHILTC